MSLNPAAAIAIMAESLKPPAPGVAQVSVVLVPFTNLDKLGLVRKGPDP